jgi:hypothetical protein
MPAAPRPTPSSAGRLDDRVDGEHQRAGDQHARRDVGALAKPMPVVAAIRRRAATAVAIADRDVDEEDPVPVDRLGQDAAGQQADRAARGGDERVDADRLRLLARLGNIVTIMPRITAEVIAPPTPWTKRAATSISCSARRRTAARRA